VSPAATWWRWLAVQACARGCRSPHQLRPIAGDSPRAEAIKVVARAHKTMIWERTRHCEPPRV